MHRRFLDVVLLLDSIDVAHKIAVRNQKAVPHAEFRLKQSPDLKRLNRHSAGLYERLAVEHIDDGADRVLLVLKGRVKPKLHTSLTLS